MDRWMSTEHKPRSRSRQVFFFLIFSFLVVCFFEGQCAQTYPRHPNVWAFLTKGSASVQCARFCSDELAQVSLRLENLPAAPGARSWRSWAAPAMPS